MYHILSKIDTHQWLATG